MKKMEFQWISRAIVILVSTTWAFGQAVNQVETSKPNKPILIALGAIFEYTKDNLPLEKQIIQDIADKGFTGSWDCLPPPWDGPGLAENPKRIRFCRRIIDLLHQNKMEAYYVVAWNLILPADPMKTAPELVGQVLNQQTGALEYMQSPGWDYGSEKAITVFAARSRDLFKKVGPVEMFFVDEGPMADPGDDCHIKRISTYWTSPTYSPASLASFRAFLAKKGFPNAGSAKFPVTTVAVKPSEKCNMGLPTIKITKANDDRLTADNNWPNSSLWNYWYEWRTDLYARWVDAITTAAWEIWGDGKNPKWRGCGFSDPPHWYTRELGVDLEKLAKVKHVDYLICGYYGTLHYQKIKETALRHGKKWGGMIELGYYGKPKGNDPKWIVDGFKQLVNDGTSLIYVYPSATFQTDRKNLPESQRECGCYYMPEQVAAWAECIKWLETRESGKK